VWSPSACGGRREVARSQGGRSGRGEVAEVAGVVERSHGSWWRGRTGRTGKFHPSHFAVLELNLIGLVN
jgi:hypothetical protein